MSMWCEWKTSFQWALRVASKTWAVLTVLLARAASGFIELSSRCPHCFTADQQEMLWGFLTGNPVLSAYELYFYRPDETVSLSTVTSVWHTWLKASHLSRLLEGFGPIVTVKRWISLCQLLYIYIIYIYIYTYAHILSVEKQTKIVLIVPDIIVNIAYVLFSLSFENIIVGNIDKSWTCFRCRIASEVWKHDYNFIV